MRKRDYLISVLLIAGFAFGFSAFNSAPVAMAYQHATPPYQDPTYESPLVNILDGNPAYAGTSPSGGGWYDVPGGTQMDLFSDGELIDRYPGIVRSLGTLAVAAVGFDIGWKIGRVIDTKFLHLQCNGFACLGSPSTNVTVTSNNWCTYGSSGCGTIGTTTDTNNGLLTIGASAKPDGAFNMIFSGPCVMSLTISNTQVVYDPAAWTGAGSMPTCMQNAWSAFNAFGAPAAANRITGTTGDCQTDANNLFGTGKWSAGVCYLLDFSETNVARALVHSAPETFGSQHVDTTTNMPTSSCGSTGQVACAPSTTITNNQYTSVVNKISTQTSNDVPGWLNCKLAPQDYPCPDGTSPAGAPEPFAIPQPFPNETYNDYVTRLRQLGFMGTVVFLDDPGYDGIPGDAYDATSPAYLLLPGTVTGVGVGTGFGAVIPLYLPGSVVAPKVPGFPSQWPGPSVTPTITPATTPTVVIQKVPASWTPPAGSPAPQGSPEPPPGSGSCNLPTIPAVNFTPLTGIAFGNQFPFGVVTWLTTVFGWFNVGPIAPSWDFNLSGLSTFVPGFSAHYTGSLTAFSPYMNAIRTLISFALWIGAIWYVGVSWIGFRGGGDISEAAEDGYDD